MPLTVNVGLNRKASENYQSAGLSINLTAELDQSLLTQPHQLQQQIDDLYAQAEQALDRQAGQETQHAYQYGNNVHKSNGSSRYQNGHHNGNGNGRSHQNKAATSSQRKAIEAICNKMGIDYYQECRDILGVEYNELGIRSASMLIDHLKSLQKAGSR